MADDDDDFVGVLLPFLFQKIKEALLGFRAGLASGKAKVRRA